jgi:hypothetical protein
MFSLLGTVLYPGDYLVITNDLLSFRNLHPATKNSLGDLEFGLNSSADQIRLYNNTGELMDAVDYQLANGWPMVTDDSGSTLELIDPFHPKQHTLQLERRFRLRHSWLPKQRFCANGRRGHQISQHLFNQLLSGAFSRLHHH